MAGIGYTPPQDAPKNRSKRPDTSAGYDVVKAAPAYSSVIGLVAGFALTAVVVVITTGASSEDLKSEQELLLGFATTLFAMSFLGCLLCAFSFASMAGDENSPATLSASMFVASAVGICLLAVLGGFHALAAAFLPDSEDVFFALCVAAAVVTPPFLWFPHWDIVRTFGPPSYEGPPRKERDAGSLVLRLCVVGALGSLLGALLHVTDALGGPHHWEYVVITSFGLVYAAGMVVAALLISTVARRPRLSVNQAWVLGCVHSVAVATILAALP